LSHHQITQQLEAARKGTAVALARRRTKYRIVHGQQSVTFRCRIKVWDRNALGRVELSGRIEIALFQQSAICGRIGTAEILHDATAAFSRDIVQLHAGQEFEGGHTTGRQPKVPARVRIGGCGIKAPAQERPTQVLTREYGEERHRLNIGIRIDAGRGDVDPARGEPRARRRPHPKRRRLTERAFERIIKPVGPHANSVVDRCAVQTDTFGKRQFPIILRNSGQHMVRRE